MRPLLSTAGHLQQRAFCGRVVPHSIAAALYCLQVATILLLAPPATSRLRLVNHLQPPPCPGGEGNQIWLKQRNPVVYWNKSSHGACCKGRQVWHLVEQGGRRLDSHGDTRLVVALYWWRYTSGDNIHVTPYTSYNMKHYWWHHSSVTLTSQNGWQPSGSVHSILRHDAILS